MQALSVLPDRFLDKVQFEPNTGCWLWTGSTSRDGYGKFHWSPSRFAHVVAFQLMNGVIPDGMELDHLCHTHDLSCFGGGTCVHRRCVNPDHLEPVTLQENARRGFKARKTHCKHGHEFTEQNTIRDDGHRRNCRECFRIRRRRWDSSHPRRKLQA